MIVWLNTDGSIGEIVSSYVLVDENGNVVSTSFATREGNNAGANEIYAYMEGGLPSGPDSLPYLTYEYPNGDTYGPQEATSKASLAIKLDKKRDLKKFKAERIYEFYRFGFPEGLIATGGNGLWSCAFTDTTGDGKTYAYGPLLFRVEKNAIAKESAITKSEYANLLSLLEGKLDKLVGDSYVKTSVGDKTYLVKKEGAGEQGVNNRSVFFEGIDVFNKKDGNKRLTINSANTMLQSEAGDAKIFVGSSGVVANGNFAIKPEGNAPAFQSTGTGTMLSDPTGAHRLTATPAKMTAVGGIKSDTAPTEEDDLATKAYVDQAVATGGDLQLNIENGAGDGSLKSRSASGASGSMSVALGHSASASGNNSIAIGSGADNRAEHGVAFGNGAVNKGQDGSMVFGKYYTASDAGACFTFGWVNEALLTLGASSNSFLKPTTFQSDVEVLGTFTARRFEAVEAENLTTGNFTIGLGKGNQSAVETLMGMYCEKYDGANYGCLAWDKTGTAYVGDCQVGPDGAISDPSKTLQPILTRDRDNFMGDGCALFWDAARLKAATNAAVRALGLDGVALGGVLSVSGGKAEYSGAIDGDACVATKKYVDDAMSPVVIRRW